MCLAISPGNKQNQGPLGRTWSRITSTPLKLLSLGAIIHLLIIASLLLVMRGAAQLESSDLISALLYGVAPLFLFGALLTWLPRRYSLSPVHHGRYGSIYLFSMIGLCLIECSVIVGENGALTAGLFILLLSWIIALQALWGMHDWLPAKIQRFSQSLLMILTLNLTLLGIEFVAQLAGFPFKAEYLIIPLTIILALELVLSVVLFSRGSENSRVITL